MKPIFVSRKINTRLVKLRAALYLSAHLLKAFEYIQNSYTDPELFNFIQQQIVKSTQRL